MILRLLSPLTLAVLLAALAGLSQAPLGRRYVPRGGPSNDLIVPLNARDPSALVMGPYIYGPHGSTPIPVTPR